MTDHKKIFLAIFALFMILLNTTAYIWNRSLKASEVPYLINTSVDILTFDKQGQVWVYGNGILSVYKNGIRTKFFTEADSPALGGKLSQLEIDNQGRVWIAPVTNDGTVELAVFDGTKWSTITYHPVSDVVQVSLSSLAVDSKGRAWSAVESQGLYITDGNIWKNYTPGNSDLLTDSVTSIAFDNQGRAWIGTTVSLENQNVAVHGGLNIFDGENWQTFDGENSPLSGSVNAITFDQQGKAWIGTSSGLYSFDGKNWISFDVSSPVWELAMDGQGRVWAMLSHVGMEVFDGDMRKYYFDPYHMKFNGIPATDGNGNVWVPTKIGTVIITPDSPQPIAYTSVILSVITTTNGLLFLTVLLLVIFSCVVMNAWRFLGFSLLGFPLYLAWIVLVFSILGQSESGYANFVFSLDSLKINPGFPVTIVGIIGGCVDILLVRSGRTKFARWGLIGSIISLLLMSCLTMVAVFQQ